MRDAVYLISLKMVGYYYADLTVYMKPGHDHDLVRKYDARSDYGKYCCEEWEQHAGIYILAFEARRAAVLDESRECRIEETSF